MINYALQWKINVGFKQVSFNDFISSFKGNAFFLEKIDGQLGVLIFDSSKESFFQTSTGNVVDNIPVIGEYISILKSQKIKSAILVTELVAMKGGIILPFNQIESIIKKSYLPQNKDLIHSYLVDIISIDKKKKKFPEAIRFINQNFRNKLSHIHVPQVTQGNLSIFNSTWKKVIKKPGIEGIVVRTSDGKAIKVKKTDTIDLVVIGAGHEDLPAWSKKQISYIITAFIDKDGLFRTSSKIGTGFTHKMRSHFFNLITGSVLYEKSGEIFVAPKYIVEVKYFRYRITPTLTLKFIKNKFEIIGKKPSITFSHLSFERLRPDKTPNKFDVRLEQIPEFSY